MILRSFGMLAEIRLGAMIVPAVEMVTASLVFRNFLAQAGRFFPSGYIMINRRVNFM
jgi:hypothetical protein